MVPAGYVRLDSLPLTPNGKLDRKALPAPQSDAYATRGYEAPEGEMEVRLAAIWAEVLKLDKVGRHDNFFHLGGHSLLAVRVITRLRQSLGVEVAIRDLFLHPVLAELARVLGGRWRSRSAADSVPLRERAPAVVVCAAAAVVPGADGRGYRGLSHSARPASEGRSRPQRRCAVRWTGS